MCFSKLIWVAGPTQPIRNVVNVYACNATMTVDQWSALAELEESLPGVTLLCGDFNARGSEWGNAITNPQGTALENALDQTTLACLNNGSMTRFANQEGHTDSATDLALVSVAALDDCTLYIEHNALSWQRSYTLPDIGA